MKPQAQSPVSPHANSDEMNHVQIAQDDDDDNQDDMADMRYQKIEEELLEIMIDAFPALEPGEISRVISEERRMIAPLEDKALLQDLVTIKLTNMVGGNALDPEYSNIRLTKGSEDQAYYSLSLFREAHVW